MASYEIEAFCRWTDKSYGTLKMVSGGRCLFETFEKSVSFLKNCQKGHRTLRFAIVETQQPSEAAA